MGLFFRKTPFPAEVFKTSLYIMADMDGDWDDTPAKAVDLTAVEPEADLPEIKLFGKWSCDEVNVSDMSLHIISPLKKNMLNICPTAAADMLPRGFARLNAQLLKDWLIL